MDDVNEIIAMCYQLGTVDSAAIIDSLLQTGCVTDLINRFQASVTDHDEIINEVLQHSLAHRELLEANIGNIFFEIH